MNLINLSHQTLTMIDNSLTTFWQEADERSLFKGVIPGPSISALDRAICVTGQLLSNDLEARFHMNEEAGIGLALGLIEQAAKIASTLEGDSVAMFYEVLQELYEEVCGRDEESTQADSEVSYEKD